MVRGDLDGFGGKGNARIIAIERFERFEGASSATFWAARLGATVRHTERPENSPRYTLVNMLYA